MNPWTWLRLPLLLKLATLVAAVFFGQRFDSIGHNEVVHGVYVVGKPGEYRIVTLDKGES